MQHTTGSFHSSDGLNIHTEAWQPDGQPKAVILFLHGIAEHIGRYQHVAAHLVNAGYAFYGLDHRAHGQSDGQPRAYIPDFEPVIADAKQVFDQIKAENPGQKIFLYGHSMGSFLATKFVLAYQDDLAGFISSGSPLLLDTIVPKIMVTIGNILNSIAPTMPLIELDLNGISRDPAVVAAYNADPLVSAGKVRVRMGVGYNRAIGPLRAKLPTIRLPLLVMHGEADPTTPKSGSELLYNQASSPDKTLKLYAGLYHEIHNEPEKATVLADITAWLDAHC
ncbi:MAG: lysophospholipase [Anaerolineaceae bacterium]|nr:lysophospholipase [Anaerolineaceae bacterium]